MSQVIYNIEILFGFLIVLLMLYIIYLAFLDPTVHE